MGGGGDDYEAQQRKQEAKKQQARNALNVIFGTAPTATTVDKSGFWGWGSTPSGEGGDRQYSRTFDQAGYDAALAGSSGQADEAARNKSARDALYSQVRTDAFTAGKRSLDERRTDASRNNKFALFAQGLNGGSEDIDQNALLERTYGEGVLDLGAKADAVRTGLASNDEQTRLGLLQSIDAGMDQGSALSSAIAQMANSADKAAADAAGTDLGDLFSTAGLLYTKSNLARGRQASNDAWSSLFSDSTGTGSRRASSGIVTSTGG